MIVWTGKGYISIVILFLTLFVYITIFPTENADYAFIFSSFVAAIFSWYFGLKWNKKNERIFIDEKTGERIKVTNRHTLFWIPMQYWGIIYSIFGIIILFQKSITFGVIITLLLLVLILITLSKQFMKSQSKSEEIAINTKKTEINNKPDYISKLKKEKSLKQFEPSDHSRFMPK